MLALRFHATFWFLLSFKTDWLIHANSLLLWKASSLVYFLLFYAEDYVTQHMEILLQGLYKASQDDSEEVVKQVVFLL